SSLSPTCGFTREIITRCLPTQAPFWPVPAVRVYSPLSSVLPTEPGAASAVPSAATGWKLTVAPTSGWPFRVTFPETRPNCRPPRRGSDLRAATAQRQAERQAERQASAHGIISSRQAKPQFLKVWNDLAAGDGGQGGEDAHVDAGADGPDVAVGEHELDAAWV